MGDGQEGIQIFLMCGWTKKNKHISMKLMYQFISIYISVCERDIKNRINGGTFGRNLSNKTFLNISITTRTYKNLCQQ